MTAPSLSLGYRVIQFLMRFCGKLIKYFDTLKKHCWEIRSGSPVSIEWVCSTFESERLLMQDSQCVLDQHCKYLVSPLDSRQKREAVDVRLTGCTRPTQKPTASRLHGDMVIHPQKKKRDFKNIKSYSCWYRQWNNH